jgi:hypothetical protein
VNLPPIVYSKAFWQSLSVLLAALAVQLGWVVLTDAVLLEAAFLALLRLFDIVPELRVKGRIR